jgi:hypothetical protein
MSRVYEFLLHGNIIIMTIYIIIHIYLFTQKVQQMYTLKMFHLRPFIFIGHLSVLTGVKK